MRVKSQPTARSVPERPIKLEPANQPPAPGPEPAKYNLRPRVATVGRGMRFSFGKREISRSFTGLF